RLTIMETRHRTAVLLSLAMLLISVPARAQIDLSGNWAVRLHEDHQDRADGPEPVDYLGLPLNQEGRARALAHEPSIFSLPERQCVYYQPHYLMFGPFGVGIWFETHPVTGEIVAWNLSGGLDRASMTIWMDGRAHPPEDAMHTFGGFTTGHWEGHTLVTHTTHLKSGYFRRNGVPSSDETTFSFRISRYDDILTIVAIMDDPV